MVEAKHDPLQISSPALAPGSLVLVTGVNGYIGSHVADQLLAVGYKVRGAVRSAERAKWLNDLFAPYGKENFQLVEVPDMTIAGAFDEAVKGTSGFIHVASPVAFTADPNEIIPVAIDATLSAVRSAFKEPTVKRFVLTSSSTAAYSPGPAQNKELIVTTSTWNEDVVKAAWAPPPYTDDRGFINYSASKTQGEQAFWKFIDEHKAERPDFVGNTVLPNANFGVVLDVKNQGLPTTAGFEKSLYDGDRAAHDAILVPQYYVDVQDDARLHVAALLLPEVKDERVFAFAGPFNVNDELDTWRRVKPGKKFIENGQDEPVHMAKVPNDRAEDLLRRLGRKGWVSLEDSFRKMLPAYEA